MHGHWPYENQTPKCSGLWKGTQFIFNKIEPHNDFVVVHENVDSKINCKTRAGGLVLVTGEERSVNIYPQGFIDQFDCIITSRDDINHPNQIQSHYLHPWRVKKTFDELINTPLPIKRRPLSAIVSNLQGLPQQRQRFELISQLKDALTDKLDWYSKGQNTFVEDKWDGLGPYKFSLAIENSVHHNYFTEKISDVFLAFAMPIYFGCPNIKDFFDDRSYLALDNLDCKSTLAVIQEAINSEIHSERLDYVKDSRALFLDKYHFVAALHEKLVGVKLSQTRQKKTVHPQAAFRESTQSSLIDRLFLRKKG